MRKTTKATLTVIALWCVVFAVTYAPIATSVQMLSQAAAAQADQDAAMPCHGASKNGASKNGASQNGGGAVTMDMSSCTCTPWCHAALAEAVAFDMMLLKLDQPMPIAGVVAAKTAQTPPLFKPPKA